MSAIRDGRYPIMLDKERHLLYDLNALDMIQDRFGDQDAVVAGHAGIQTSIDTGSAGAEQYKCGN